MGSMPPAGRQRSDMDRATDRSRPPSRQLLWLELRGIWELQAFFAAYPLLRLAPRGDGHPVLVLPGLAASDASSRPLRGYLTEGDREYSRARRDGSAVVQRRLEGRAGPYAGESGQSAEVAAAEVAEAARPSPANMKNVRQD